ncbi:MAG: hypothetical protein IJW24_00250 [Clostridia bacterium]|nr:hypothetical protein [Clostridia bacterium]
MSKSENLHYEDLLDLEFSRPHKIEHKDELQLKQVYLEEKLNTIGKLEKHKHSKSTSFGLVAGLFSMALIVLSMIWFVHFQTLKDILIAGLMAAVSITFIVLETIILPKLIKRENNEFVKKHKTIIKEISEICFYAQSLLGGEHEQK